VVDDEGDTIDAGQGGTLIIRKPWPSMLRTVWGDDERFQNSYFGKYEDQYMPGDGAHKDQEGYYWILGRMDDVLNVSGHRIGTMEIESAIVNHNGVAEAAVIGRSDELTGQSVVAFVTLKEGINSSDEVKQEITDVVADKIGKMARP